MFHALPSCRVALWTAFATVPMSLTGAAEIIVPTQMPLSVALQSSMNGDTITLLPTGSPYQQFPGFSFANKRLTIRGATGNPADVVIDGAALDIVLRISGAGAGGSVLEDLTIRNGRSATAAESTGAGIHITGANITIRNCVIRDNLIVAADGNGAGIYATASSVTIEDCLFQSNRIDSATGDGGAIYLNGGNHVLRRNTFLNNGVSPAIALAAGSIGGAFYADGGSAVITRCRFEGNRASEGGAMGVSGSMTMTIDACEFVTNSARNGGGFYITSAAGGAVPILRNCLFRGNSSNVNDSAVFTNKGALITNCTFSANSTTGSFVIGGSPAVRTVVLDNSIIWGNTTGTGIMPPTIQAVVRRNIFQAAYAGGTGSGFNQVIDPLFVNPASDFQLAPTSPAIDAGDSNLYNGPFDDLAGLDRGVDVPTIPDTGSSP
jgi:hypothetical protein